MIDETQMSKAPDVTRHEIQENYWSFYPSEPFTLGHFNVRYPVLGIYNFDLCLLLKMDCLKKFYNKK